MTLYEMIGVLFAIIGLVAGVVVAYFTEFGPLGKAIIAGVGLGGGWILGIGVAFLVGAYMANHQNDEE